MRLTFWGTRGSIPTPLTADEFRTKVKRILMNSISCSLSDENSIDRYLDSLPMSDAIVFGGNTPCVEFTEGSHSIIFDCGSGLRLLGHQMAKEGLKPGQEINIFQSHTHWDHLIGFPFFQPAYADTVINIYGVHPNLKERFEQQMDKIHFPITMDDMRAKINFHQLKSDSEIEIGPFVIKNKGLHHPGGSYSYRVETAGKSAIYASDGEYKDPVNSSYKPFINFFNNADVLIFDAMYPTIAQTIEKENYGHSTAIIGVGFAMSAGVKKLVLFHHDPESNDSQITKSLEEARQFYHCNKKGNTEHELEIVTSYDGLVLEI